MDKKLMFPTTGLLVVAITAEAVPFHREPEAHVDAVTKALGALGPVGKGCGGSSNNQ